ncbi:MAG: CHAP domain-containing protein, partial [Candidatus Gracilibacteria bacterium]|nr:CHAP domain-containing protein [Candidatus Gracilibacteria bacterium]
PKVVVVKNTKKSSKSTKKGYTSKTGGKSEYIEDEGDYDLVKRTPQWSFYRGNCTRYVAQYKDVDWSGNAKDWLYNARAKGHSTGSDASIGSIVVFNGRGYNPSYGHVGIVIGIKGDDIIVKDMNYRRLNEVTVRKVPINDKTIKGYIYVD